MLLQKMLKKKEGFTLVELLIVIAIIAILAAIAIPQFTRYRNRAYKSELESDAKNAYTAAQAYLTDNPDETVNALQEITDAGARLSSNVSFVSGTMDLTSGNIKLTSTKNVAGQDDALIYANGKITIN